MSSCTPDLSALAETTVRFPAEAFRFIAWLAGLNLTWEIAQLPFYTLWRNGSPAEITFAIMHCTAGDVLISLFSTAAALLFVRLRWPQNYMDRLVFVSIFVGFSLAYTVYSEWQNVIVRKSWAYTELMPVLPPLGTGLTPLLQWFAVPVLAWQLARVKSFLSDGVG